MMGDISAEPSMEDILSSIKRIIAEEGEAVPIRGRRGVRAATPAARDLDPADNGDEAEVLELNDPMPVPVAPAEAAQAPHEEPMPQESRAERAPAERSGAERSGADDADVAPILSQRAESATRGSLEALSRMMVRPEPASDGTLEGMVREMLRPMLREWLDAKLPPMVETMVAAEIARITGKG